ncbi:MAG: hypothetical protein ACKOA1_01335 [Bacteroidota bacterium]
MQNSDDMATTAPYRWILWTLLGVMTLSIPKVNAQGIRFCETVNPDGTCVHEGTFFRIREGSDASVQVLVKSTNALAGETAVLDIFRLNDIRKEVFESSVKVRISPEWLWFAQPLKFKHSGEYAVYAYDGVGRLIGAAKINFEYNR